MKQSGFFHDKFYHDKWAGPTCSNLMASNKQRASNNSVLAKTQRHVQCQLKIDGNVEPESMAVFITTNKLLVLYIYIG